MMNRSFLALTLFAALVFGGCRSFQETVKPLVNYQPPVDHPQPIYMTGTKSYDQADPSRMQVEVWRVNSNNYPDSINLFVRVFDTEGNLITNLAPPYYKGGEDYRKIWSGLTEQIGDDGRPERLEQFSVREYSDQDGIPYEIALALDYSGTMGSNIRALEDAAAAFIKLKRPQDRISVVKFDRAPQLVASATNSQSELLSKLTGSGLTGYGGYTALFSAARFGAEQVALSPAEHPRAVVLFSDGEDNASTIVASDVYKYSRENDIPIFTVAFGPVNREVLTDMAEYSGGRFYQTYTTDEIRRAFEDIYRSLRNYYVVTYKPLYQVGKHIAHITLTPPNGAGKELGATAIYNTLTGNVLANDVITEDALGRIYFDYDQTALRPESQTAIGNLVEIMRMHPRLKIEVRGHTDSRGGEEYNQKLSDARAEAVRIALAEGGIDPRRLRARGFGLTKPVASNETDEGRQKNRRTEFVILAR